MSEELFSNKNEVAGQKAAPVSSASNSGVSSGQITSVAARLKVLEERYTNLSRREQLAEKNVLSFERDIRSEMRVLQGRVVDTRKHLSDVRERLETLQGQVGNAAQKYDVRVLESFLNIVQPLSFVTRAEAKKLLEDWQEAEHADREGQSEEK